ncbi:hypothetical protein SAMN04488503_2794 [Humidesulfovibrio mexicanus]|uniref:Uncharacterized protein n=1 Tax=Humidesulfovibrio mexicanus TaxID=147047 RepID=A0A239BV26_9BACT|nr:hypothetical protein [Humidesulfovibrio mexicanus]SNS11268.1 hypothetical protein SAMN04488503_2794 [Humidesulfovibrio mexicanus]
MSYPYASPGLLAEPCRYMYPPYGGADFLCAWAEQRGRAMAELAGVAALPQESPLPGLCLALLESFAGRQADLDALRAALPAPKPAPKPASEANGAEVALAPLLRALLVRAASGENSAADAQWLPRLARKIEVAKRLFPAYAPHPLYGLGTPTDPDAGNRDIGLHALLAAALGLCPGPDTELRLLNAQLKLNDTLCSELPALAARPENAALALLSLRAEVWRVNALSPEDAPWR